MEDGSFFEQDAAFIGNRRSKLRCRSPPRMQCRSWRQSKPHRCQRPPRPRCPQRRSCKPKRPCRRCTRRHRMQCRLHRRRSCCRPSPGRRRKRRCCGLHTHRQLPPIHSCRRTRCSKLPCPWGKRTHPRPRRCWLPRTSPRNPRRSRCWTRLRCHRRRSCRRRWRLGLHR